MSRRLGSLWEAIYAFYSNVPFWLCICVSHVHRFQNYSCFPFQVKFFLLKTAWCHLKTFSKQSSCPLLPGVNNFHVSLLVISSVSHWKLPLMLEVDTRNNILMLGHAIHLFLQGCFCFHLNFNYFGCTGSSLLCRLSSSCRKWLWCSGFSLQWPFLLREHRL